MLNQELDQDKINYYKSLADSDCDDCLGDGYIEVMPHSPLELDNPSYDYCQCAWDKLDL